MTKSFKAQLIDDNYVEGFASTYGNIDSYGDIVERGAFTKTLQESKHKVKFLWQHDMKQPIGVIEELRDEPQGLYFKARFSNSTAGQDARIQLQEGVVDSFSIGFRLMKSLADRAPNGRPINRLQEIALAEISAVTIPANDQAKLIAVKSALSTDFPECDEEEIEVLFKEYQAFLDMKAAQESDEEDEETDDSTDGDTVDDTTEPATDETTDEADEKADPVEEDEEEVAEDEGAESDDEEDAFNKELDAKWLDYKIRKRLKSRA
ncbi:HK97 family phage prohead protease [Sphingopyxis sp. H081]|uniref:HK97 family phage prohead protease n=1 Tax=Sphingopyxis sp. H081 TaxID=1759080 RepID=UPI0018D1F974|nr:HK97 family phage prohead protease [Sphingopyxis sp. H081]